MRKPSRQPEFPPDDHPLVYDIQSLLLHYWERTFTEEGKKLVPPPKVK